MAKECKGIFWMPVVKSKSDLGSIFQNYISGEKKIRINFKLNFLIIFSPQK
jgi:hypothetical protein